jgi:hypothetical protein
MVAGTPLVRAGPALYQGMALAVPNGMHMPGFSPVYQGTALAVPNGMHMPGFSPWVLTGRGHG